jgi:hypothetical protein
MLWPPCDGHSRAVSSRVSKQAPTVIGLARWPLGHKRALSWRSELRLYLSCPCGYCSLRHQQVRQGVRQRRVPGLNGRATTARFTNPALTCPRGSLSPCTCPYRPRPAAGSSATRTLPHAASTKPPDPRLLSLPVHWQPLHVGCSCLQSSRSMRFGRSRLSGTRAQSALNIAIN